MTVRFTRWSGLLASLTLLGGCVNSAPEVVSVEAAETSAAEATPESTAPELPTPRWKAEVSEKFAEPWPTDVTMDELFNTAMYRSYEFFDEVKDPECVKGYKLHLGDPMLDEHKPGVEELVKSTTQIFCDYIEDEIIVIGGDYDFVKTVIADNSYPSDDFGGVCGYPVENDYASACAYRGVAWIGINWGTIRNGEVSTEGRRITIAAHEIFHLIHDDIDPGPGGQSPPPGDPFFRPVWFIEGGGEFFGRIIASYLELYPYDRFTPTDRGGGFLEVSYLSDLGLLEVTQNRAFGTENYFSGQRAMEYMVASKGMGAVLGVWENMGEGMDFSEAFESSMGISVPEFYEKFNEMHTNLYETDLVTNSY